MHESGQIVACYEGLALPRDSFCLSEGFRFTPDYSELLDTKFLVAHLPEGDALVLQGNTTSRAGGDITLGWITFENRVITHLDFNASQTSTPVATATATPSPTATPTPGQSGSDRAVLVALYHSTGGADWDANTNWLSDRPIGEWHGVTTDSNGRVIELDLYHNQLTGEIPPELGDLSNLTYLYLNSNQLTGEIPPELGGLSNLTYLYLNSNQLTGEIPPELGGLSNLTWLYLSSNRLTGEIPPELGGLSNLTELYLYGNQLTGEIPPELGRLSNLTELYLYGNQLTGEIPPELGGLSNLMGLGLSSNRLTGCIPEGLRDVWENDFASLNLPDCDAATPRPTATPASSQAVTAEITQCSIGHVTTSNGETERWSQVSISGTVYAHEDVSSLVVTVRTDVSQIGREEFALGAGESRDFYFYGGPFGHATLGSCTVSLDWVKRTVGPLIPDSCSNGIAVPSPHENTSLVSDCEALLDAKDTLRGTATLNWSVSASIISQWGRYHRRWYAAARHMAAALRQRVDGRDSAGAGPPV